MNDQYEETNPANPQPAGAASGKSMHRRGFVGAAALTGLGLVGSARALAQDATPPSGGGSQEQAATPASQDESANARFPTAVPVGPTVPPEFGTATNWPIENYDLKATRNVQGTKISSENVSQLGVAWTYPITISSQWGSLACNPIIVDGVIYMQDTLANVYAIELKTGKEVWVNQYNQPVPSGGPNGAGFAYGLVYYTLGGTGDVIAADPKTGAEKWKTNILGPRDEGITLAPLIYDNTLYVSTIPGTGDAFYNGGQRGVIYALDASTGGVIWYFDTTADNLWGNARINSGGGLWHVPAVDDSGNLFVGIANPAPYPGAEGWPAGSSRPGTNLYTDTLMKIDPTVGAMEWYLDVKPHDLFDLDNHLSPILATVQYNGVDTPVVFSSGKHGFVLCADQRSGYEYWRTPVGIHQNDGLTELPTDGSSVTVFPGTLGGVETCMAYADNVVYAPIYNMKSVYTPEGIDPSSLDITKTTGGLVALDATTGSILWDVKTATGQLAAATVANDLVLSAGLDGVVHAYSTKDGSEVWSWQAPAGINSPLAVTDDYIIVPAGGPLFKSDDSPDAPDKATAGIVALKIGATGAATPSA